MLLTANKQKRQKYNIREGAFAYLQTVMSNMQSTTIIAILTLFWVLNSCVFSNCEKLNLSDADIEWFSCYEEGQTLYFENQYGQVDTLVVFTSKVYYSQCNKFELDPYQNQNEEIRLNDKNIKQLSGNNRVQIVFTQENKNSSSRKVFHMFGSSYATQDDFSRKNALKKIKLKHQKKIIPIFLKKSENISHTTRISSEIKMFTKK